MRRRDGFTFLEICLAVMIGLMLLGLAIPSINGLFAEQRLTETFEDFDKLVREAQKRSVSEGRSYLLRWDDNGVTLEPAEPTPDDAAGEVSHYSLEDGAEMTLERPAALEKTPPMEWIFWRSGTCEPVIVGYAGPPGSWLVRYDPLSARAKFIDKIVK